VEKSIGKYALEFLTGWGVPADIALILKAVIITTLILMIANLANFITCKILLVYIKRLIRRSQNDWDDLLIEKKALNRLANFAPVLVVYFVVPKELVQFPQAVEIIQKGLEMLMLLPGMHV